MFDDRTTVPLAPVFGRQEGATEAAKCAAELHRTVEDVDQRKDELGRAIDGTGLNAGRVCSAPLDEFLGVRDR